MKRDRENWLSGPGTCSLPERHMETEADRETEADKERETEADRERERETRQRQSDRQPDRRTNITAE
jgi:hypothetical protein